MFKKCNPFYLKLGTALTVLIVATVVIWSNWHNKGEAVYPLDNADTLYHDALTRLSAAENIQYKVTGTKKLEKDGTITEENYTQKITYESRFTDSFRGFAEEDLVIGSQNIKSLEHYSDGIALLSIQGANFQSQMAAEDYRAKYVPPAPIDPSLYAQITGTKEGDICTITFHVPTAAENWVTDEAYIITGVTATATIDNNGNLVSSNYSVIYELSDMIVSLQVTVEIDHEPAPAIIVPDSKTYVQIDDVTIPQMLERACGYLTAFPSIYAKYTDFVYCEAFGDERFQTTTLSINKGADYVMGIDTTVSVSNRSKAGSAVKSTKSDRFANGQYSYSADGIHFEVNKSVSQEDMAQSCHNILFSTILHPGYIASVETHEEDGIIRIKLIPADDFANILAEDACIALYNDAAILTEQAITYKTDSLFCYLDFEKATGYPISSGFSYIGIYEISGIAYQLQFQADQLYSHIPFESAAEPSSVN